MKFCDNDGRVMIKDTTTGYVIFKCMTCGFEKKGTAKDICIRSAVFSTKETTEKYRTLINLAPFDRTNHQVAKTCTSCGRNYMTQIKITGESEIIIHCCKCN